MISACVDNGEEIIIVKSGKPIAPAIPIRDKLRQRNPGSAKGKTVITEDLMGHYPYLF